MGPGGLTGLQNRVARRNVARMVRLHPFSANISHSISVRSSIRRTTLLVELRALEVPRTIIPPSLRQDVLNFVALFIASLGNVQCKAQRLSEGDIISEELLPEGTWHCFWIDMKAHQVIIFTNRDQLPGYNTAVAFFGPADLPGVLSETEDRAYDQSPAAGACPH